MGLGEASRIITIFGGSLPGGVCPKPLSCIVVAAVRGLPCENWSSMRFAPQGALLVTCVVFVPRALA